MSVQFMLNNCVQFSINYRKIATQMLSRGGRLYVSEYPTAQPFRITIKPHDYLSYSEIRAAVQALDNLDRISEEVISFASVDPNLTWLVRYQGAFTPTQIAGTQVNSFTGNIFSLSLPVGAVPGTVIFAPGDFMQPIGTRYTYKVQSQVVVPATGNIVQVVVHRPIIGVVSTGTAIRAGVDVTIPVVMTQNPFTQFNPFNNTGYIAWSGTFDLIENITG